jgi:membrane-associated phospholipid phosphatase
MTNVAAFIKEKFLFVDLRQELNSARQKHINSTLSKSFYELLLFAICLLGTAACLYFIFDYYVGFHTINRIGHSLPPVLLQTVTFIGDTTLALALMLIFARRSPASVWVVFVAALIGSVITQYFKRDFLSYRPLSLIEAHEMNTTGEMLFEGSFPSGHSMTIFILVATLYLFSNRRSTQLMLIGLGLSVASSRVLVGAHWPIDVLVGSGFGILSTLLALLITRKWTWGFSLWGHLFIVALMFSSAVMLFHHDGGYPLASSLGVLVAVASLLNFTLDYGHLVVRWQLWKTWLSGKKPTKESA